MSYRILALYGNDYFVLGSEDSTRGVRGGFCGDGLMAGLFARVRYGTSSDRGSDVVIGFRRFDVIIIENDKLFCGPYVFIYRFGDAFYNGGLLHWLSYLNPVLYSEHGEGFRNFNNKSLDNCN